MEELIIAATSVSYSGVFRFRDLYAQMRDIVTGMGYKITENKMIETRQGASKKIYFNWACDKDVDDYSRLQINVDCTCSNIKDVEAKKSGQTIKVEKADIDVDFQARLLTDYRNRWEANPVFKFLKVVYDKYLYAQTLSKYSGQLWNEIYAVSNEVKSFLNMARFR